MNTKLGLLLCVALVVGSACVLPSAVTPTAVPASVPMSIEFDEQDPLWADSTCNWFLQDMTQFGGDQWNGSDQLFGNGLDCELGFEINVEQSGTYQVVLYATYASDFGQLRVRFAGGSTPDNSKDIDLYDPTVRPTGAIDLGTWQLTAGKNIFFVVTVTGKNEASSGYNFGLDYMTLTP